MVLGVLLGDEGIQRLYEVITAQILSAENVNLVRLLLNGMKERVEWIFNPPAASHMGGVWERVIQSVKKTLRGLMKDQLVSDETLRTLIVEVEGILNGRPLTSVSDLPNDLDVLTPNHLLLFRSNPNVPPGVFEKSDSCCKRRWRQVQYMADLFWKRWLKEYLPMLQERRKWNKRRRNLQAGTW
jgi:hypothetical protein